MHNCKPQLNPLNVNEHSLCVFSTYPSERDREKEIRKIYELRARIDDEDDVCSRLQWKSQQSPQHLYWRCRGVFSLIENMLLSSLFFWLSFSFSSSSSFSFLSFSFLSLSLLALSVHSVEYARIWFATNVSHLSVSLSVANSIAQCLCVCIVQRWCSWCATIFKVHEIWVLLLLKWFETMPFFILIWL